MRTSCRWRTPVRAAVFCRSPSVGGHRASVTLPMWRPARRLGARRYVKELCSLCEGTAELYPIAPWDARGGILEVPQFFLGWRGHPAPRLRRRPRRGATRSRTPTRRTRPRWRRTSMPRREIMRREARERLFFVSSSESRTTIQVNCELDLKSTANLTSSQVATSLQVKLGLHFYRHSDFTSSERERPLWGCFWGAWRGTCLEVVIGESVHKDRPCGRAER